MREFRITQSVYDAMVERAEADYPEETCGFIFGPDDTLEVVPMRNVQNDLHASDPERFDRDARTAYYFDPSDMQRVLEERQAASSPFRSIYHSHPDHDAYFSETDSAAAAAFGEPNFPGVVYLVLSVKEGKVADIKAFDWNPDEERFAEAPLAIDP